MSIFIFYSTPGRFCANFLTITHFFYPFYTFFIYNFVIVCFDIEYFIIFHYDVMYVILLYPFKIVTLFIILPFVSYINVPL